jgi:predicted site-specific integrase-resolvase
MWFDARTTGRALGVSEKTLARWRKAGLLQVGIHWRRKFPSANSPVLYQLELCNRTMNEVTARSAALLET